MTDTPTDTIPRPLNDGLFLVLNNCEDRLQLVLGEQVDEQARLLCSRELVVPGRTAGFLIPAVGEMLGEQERSATELVGIACTRGPGSFTGIRLALSAAAGIRAGCPAGQRPLLAGLDYLPLVAAAPLVMGQTVYVLTYARRGQVFLQGYSPDGSPLAPVAQYSAQEAVERIQATGQPTVLAGSGLHKNHDCFAPLQGVRITLLPPEWNHPGPDTLLAAATRADYVDNDIEPAYGRNADAEDNLDDIATKRGIDPTAARRMLDESRRG